MSRGGWSKGGLLAALALLGCGGGGDAQSCGRVSPCGGDVVGTWRAAGSCYDAGNFMAALTTQLALYCPPGVSLTQTASDADRAISAVFAADGTFSGTSTWSGSIQFQVPFACLPGSTCADLDVALGRLVDPSNGLVGTACTGTSDCSCTLSYGGTSSETGTFTISGSTLETAHDGVVTDTPYCVSGSTLHLDYLVGSKVTTDSVLARE
jgi:hypothetical protein